MPEDVQQGGGDERLVYSLSMAGVKESGGAGACFGLRRATEVRQAQSLHRHHVSADLGTPGWQVGGLEFASWDYTPKAIGFAARVHRCRHLARAHEVPSSEL